MSEPITRVEMYLAALNGESVTIPAPITRIDKYLYTLCQTGIGGGATDEQIAAAVAAYLEENPVGSFAMPLLYDLTTTEEVRWIDTGKNAFVAKNFLVIDLYSVATASNEADYNGVASVYSEGAVSDPSSPWANRFPGYCGIVAPITYDHVTRYICIRGDDGYWSSLHTTRTHVNNVGFDATMNTNNSIVGNITGLIIGDSSAAAGTRVMGVGSRLRIWGY